MSSDDYVKLAKRSVIYVAILKLSLTVFDILKHAILYKGTDDFEQLTMIHGVRTVYAGKSVQLQARPLNNARDIFNSCLPFFKNKNYEHMLVSFVDENNIPVFTISVTDKEISQMDWGSIASALSIKFKDGANVPNRIVVVHNHPMTLDIGMPSKADIKSANKLLNYAKKNGYDIIEFYSMSVYHGASAYFKNPHYYSKNGYTQKELFQRHPLTMYNVPKSIMKRMKFI